VAASMCSRAWNVITAGAVRSSRPSIDRRIGAAPLRIVPCCGRRTDLVISLRKKLFADMVVFSERLRFDESMMGTRVTARFPRRRDKRASRVGDCARDRPAVAG
jgi:hypothetical protein